MEALLLKIRNNLRVHRQNIKSRQNREWRNVLILILVTSMGLLLLYPFIQTWRSHNLFLIFLFSPILFLQGLNKFFDGLPQKNILVLAFSLVFTALSAFVWFINPSFTPAIFPHSAWSSLLAILLAWVILAWIFEKNIPQSRRYSLLPSYPFIHIASGAFMGIGMALHALLVARFLPNFNLPLPTLNTEKTVWLFGLFAGLIIPSEELFFRGRLFSLLFDSKTFPLSKTILWISLLNLIVYIPPIIYLSSSINTLSMGIITFIYKFILSAVSVYIIYRWRNMYVCFAANLAFSMVMIQPFYL